MSDVKKIWMHVLGNGRCTVNEIAEDTKISPDSVRNHIKHMYDAGNLSKFGQGRVSYGVTRDSTIPLHVTIRDLDVGGIRVGGMSF